MAMQLNEKFTEEEINMKNKYMKIHFTWLVIINTNKTDFFFTWKDFALKD